jgi:hypothetical protein
LIGFLIERWQSIGAVLELASRVAAISLLGTKAKSRNRDQIGSSKAIHPRLLEIVVNPLANRLGLSMSGGDSKSNHCKERAHNSHF